MDISIFGIGYVGAVTAACLARGGHSIVAVDPNPVKVALLNDGKAPIVEAGLPELLSEAKNKGLLLATDNVQKAIAETDLSIICVGTPSLPNGKLDLGYVRMVCEQVGAELAKKSSYHSVVIRSTMLPGSMAEVVIPTC